MPMTKNEVEDDIPKSSRQWSELEKKNISLNSKAMNVLFCTLDKKEFYRVSSCESAQEIWNKLEAIQKGQIKLKSLKSVDTQDNMSCSKWNKMKVCILYILNLRTQ